MKWHKKERIFVVKKNSKWMQSHSSHPIPDRIKKNLFKIYFNTRDSKNRSSVGYIVIDITNPTKILEISDIPVLSHGNIGCFDDCGIMASSLVNYNGKKFLYYIGWNNSTTVPFRWSIGLAISSDNGKSFQKFSEGPILDRSYIDPYLVTSPTVIFERGLWRMWYSSATKWKSFRGKLSAPYKIKYASSKNGINWKRDGTVCIDFKNKHEYAIGRSSIVKDAGRYKMWYSYAGKQYRIGYAESNDGIKWKRKDEQAGISVCKTGWDSQSIEYPSVFKHNDNWYMLYCGNEFGKTGFGYAIMD